MKKLLTLILTLLSTVCLTLGLTACGGNDNEGNQPLTEQQKIYNSYVAYAEQLGQTPLSYEEWLASIKGEKGDKGDKGDPGQDGADGADGAKGDKGSKGDKGDQGEQGIQGDKGDQGIQGEKGDKGDQGIQGEKGDKGDQGIQGETGATIEKIEFDENGKLVITLTDGTVLDPVELPEKEEHVHSFGEWLVYTQGEGSCEDKFFYRQCEDCSEVVFKKGTYEDHSFETVTVEPTCQAGGYDIKTCSICGFEERVNQTPISDHKYEEDYRYDNSFHYIKCEDCTAEKDRAEHTADNSGYCTVCDAPVGATEGIVYDLSSDGTYYEVIDYEGTATKIIIAETYNNKPVKSIYKNVFSEKNITSVVIPNSVTSIGERAFYECRSLTSIAIPDSVTSIGERAFFNCDSLTSVTIGDSVTSIGGHAFCSCSSLESVVIGDSVTSIGNYAFSGCSSLTSIEIPNSVTSIGNCAFNYCYSLTSIEIPNSVTSIGDMAFNYCTNLFVEKDYVRYVKANGNDYFLAYEITYKNLSTYTIQNTTKILGYNSSSDSGLFYGCSRLTSITIPNSVTSIGGCAFNYCTSLTSVIIGNGVTSIESGAFNYCTSLTSVTIGDSVTSIGECVFYGCTSLTSIEIPNSVTSIGEKAFYNCTSLESITFEDTSTWYRTTNFTDWQNKTGGTQTSVTVPLTNATYFKSNYYYYWYKL